MITAYFNENATEFLENNRGSGFDKNLIDIALSDGAYEVFAYEEDGDYVGYIAGCDEVCLAIEVLPDFREQGIGRKLVEHSKMFYPKNNNAPDFWDAVS